MSEKEINGNEEKKTEHCSKSGHHHHHHHNHHSGGSHSHHSSHSHHGSHRHSGSSSHSEHHSERSKHSGESDKKKNTTTSFSAEYSKHKKIRLWWRSSFIAIICIALAWLVFLIANAGNTQDGIFAKKYSASSDIERLQSQIAELKAENVRLQYELDKYIDAYGEFGADEE